MLIQIMTELALLSGIDPDKVVQDYLVTGCSLLLRLPEHFMASIKALHRSNIIYCFYQFLPQLL